MSLSKIKRELRDDVKKNLMVQKIQQKKFGDVNATRREVENFYYQFKDMVKVRGLGLFKNFKLVKY